jgi:DNA-binding LacI/PurR family transcriptional regulator
MRFAAFTNPTLTTVRAPEVEIGRLAGEMLLKLISGERVDKRHIYLECELMVRGSCGAQ